MYQPSLVPPQYEPYWIAQELARIQQALILKDFLLLSDTTTAPAKPRDGEVRYTSGLWDPGAGQGVYAFYNSTWNKLG